MTAPVASFSLTPAASGPNVTVSFTDTSTNTPTSWLWTFGDGTTSTSQNPTHAYSGPGSYTVSLEATNVDGHDTKTTPAAVRIGGGGLVCPRRRRAGGAITRHRPGRRL